MNQIENNSNSDPSNEPEEEEKLSKLKDHLEHREKKLKEMSSMLAELNGDLNAVLFSFFHRFFKVIIPLKKALEKQHDLLSERKALVHKIERKVNYKNTGN